jgi:hypothetical protein
VQTISTCTIVATTIESPVVVTVGVLMMLMDFITALVPATSKPECYNICTMPSKCPKFVLQG